MCTEWKLLVIRITGHYWAENEVSIDKWYTTKGVGMTICTHIKPNLLNLLLNKIIKCIQYGSNESYPLNIECTEINKTWRNMKESIRKVWNSIILHLAHKTCQKKGESICKLLIEKLFHVWLHCVNLFLSFSSTKGQPIDQINKYSYILVT